MILISYYMTDISLTVPSYLITNICICFIYTTAHFNLEMGISIHGGPVEETGRRLIYQGL
jgi:hypothetical protein